MRRISLEVKKRDVKKKGMLNDYRGQGLIPAIAYGEGVEPTPIVLDRKGFLKTLHKEGVNIIFDLTLDGTPYPSIIKEMQKDPITDVILHMDFQLVNINKPVHTNVPVEVVGEAKGVKIGGLLEQEVYELEVEAKPLDLPEKIVTDVSELDIHDVIFVKDLDIPETVKVYTNPGTPVVSVVTPTKEEAPSPVEEEVVAEGEGNKEEATTTTEEAKKE